MLSSLVLGSHLESSRSRPSTVDCHSGWSDPLVDRIQSLFIKICLQETYFYWLKQTNRRYPPAMLYHCTQTRDPGNARSQCYNKVLEDSVFTGN